MRYIIIWAALLTAAVAVLILDRLRLRAETAERERALETALRSVREFFSEKDAELAARLEELEGEAARVRTLLDDADGGERYETRLQDGMDSIMSYCLDVAIRGKEGGE